MSSEVLTHKEIQGIRKLNQLPYPCAQSPSRVQLFVTPWTVACQAPLSMEFSRQEHWSGLPFPSPGDVLDPEIKHRYPALQADSLPSKPPLVWQNFKVIVY